MTDELKAEREAFENLYCQFPFEFYKERDAEGDYRVECMRYRWEAWLARAKLDRTHTTGGDGHE